MANKEVFIKAIMEAASSKKEPFIDAVHHYGYKVVDADKNSFSLLYRPSATGPSIAMFIKAVNQYLQSNLSIRKPFGPASFNGKYAYTEGTIESIKYKVMFGAGCIMVKRSQAKK